MTSSATSAAREPNPGAVPVAGVGDAVRSPGVGSVVAGGGVTDPADAGVSTGVGVGDSTCAGVGVSAGTAGRSVTANGEKPVVSALTA
jgi:hypothetical protein